jgi:hypothetical protein
MDIEGLINHTLASYTIERQYIAKQLFDNKERIQFWEDVQAIHANESVQNALRGVTNIRQILSSENYMDYLIKKNVCEPLCFMDFPLKTIEFYLHLKHSCHEHTIGKLNELDKDE